MFTRPDNYCEFYVCRCGNYSERNATFKICQCGHYIGVHEFRTDEIIGAFAGQQFAATGADPR